MFLYCFSKGTHEHIALTEQLNAKGIKLHEFDFMLLTEECFIHKLQVFSHNKYFMSRTHVI